MALLWSNQVYCVLWTTTFLTVISINFKTPFDQHIFSQKHRAPSDDSPSIDPYGIRQFLESAHTDENMSLFKDNDDSPDMDSIGLDWIA